MSESHDESIEQLEDLLDGASRRLSSLQALNAWVRERASACAWIALPRNCWSSVRHP
jgi:hypothetical protein